MGPGTGASELGHSSCLASFPSGEDQWCGSNISETGTDPFLLTPEMWADPDGNDPTSVSSADALDGKEPGPVSGVPENEGPPLGMQGSIDR